MRYCATQEHTKMGILFVYAPHVDSKMGVYQNVTPVAEMAISSNTPAVPLCCFKPRNKFAYCSKVFINGRAGIVQLVEHSSAASSVLISRTTNVCSWIRGRDRLSCHAGCQEVSRCRTRDESQGMSPEVQNRGISGTT